MMKNLFQFAFGPVYSARFIYQESPSDREEVTEGEVLTFEEEALLKESTDRVERFLKSTEGREKVTELLGSLTEAERADLVSTLATGNAENITNKETRNEVMKWLGVASVPLGIGASMANESNTGGSGEIKPAAGAIMAISFSLLIGSLIKLTSAGRKWGKAKKELRAMGWTKEKIAENESEYRTLIEKRAHDLMTNKQLKKGLKHFFKAQLKEEEDLSKKERRAELRELRKELRGIKDIEL